MSATLTSLEAGALPALAPAAAAGFPRLSYTVDVLDGRIDPPEEMIGVGLGLDYMRAFLPQLPSDPLRRRIASGEVPVGPTPTGFVNTGEEVVTDGLRFAGAPDLLRWCLEEGIRTGLSFRIPLDRGRCCSLNFYSPRAFAPAELEAATAVVFLAGHRAHAQLAPRCAPPRALLLSRREAECLEAMARGGSNGEIARELGLSAETVKDYARSLFRKLGARNRAEAVTRGLALNYFAAPPVRGDSGSIGSS